MSQQLTQLKRCSSRNEAPELCTPEFVEKCVGLESDSIRMVHQIADTASSFEKDLLTSRVYMRAMNARSDVSLPLSTGNSTTVSLASELSLANVSNIFTLPLPVSTEDIWNHRHYSAAKHTSVETSKIDRTQFVSSSMTTMEHRVPLTQSLSGIIHENGELSLPSKKVILLGLSMNSLILLLFRFSLDQPLADTQTTCRCFSCREDSGPQTVAEYLCGWFQFKWAHRSSNHHPEQPCQRIPRCVD